MCNYLKYGLLVFRKTISRDKVGIHNIGDNIQAIAMRSFYVKYMGINQDDIVEVDYHSLSTYVGEDVILPINFYFLGLKDAKETWFPTSQYIHPVFIGLHLQNDYVTNEEIIYLNEKSPIGCRDEYTYINMKKRGISAYIGGCITATLPLREKTEHQKYTYLVDVDEKVKEYLPARLKNQIVKKTHEIVGPFEYDFYRQVDAIAEKQLNEYKNKAALVITSRLHCASPCIAMGIPTILIVKEKTVTFSWIDNLIDIYTVDEISEIDFDKVVEEYKDYEKIKGKMINVIKKQIGGKYTDEINDLTRFFSNSNHYKFHDYFGKIRYSINKVLSEKSFSSYSIWGATTLAEVVYDYIGNNFPYARLEIFVDEYSEVCFHERKAKKIDDIVCGDEKEMILICTPAHAKDEIIIKLQAMDYKGIALFPDGTIYRTEK